MAAGHLGTIIFKSGGKRKHHHLATTYTQVEAGTEFRAQNQVLEDLDTFNYLVRMLSFDDRDWPMLAWNLHKYWIKWGRLLFLLYQNVWGVWSGFDSGIHVRPPLDVSQAVSTGQASTMAISAP